MPPELRQDVQRVLIGACTDDHINVRKKAQAALDALRMNPKPQDAAWKMHRWVRLQKWDKAAKHGGKAIDPILATARQLGPKDHQFERALMAIARIEDPRALDVLGQLIRDKDTVVVIKAAGAIHSNKEPRALDMAVALLTHKEDKVRFVTARGIAYRLQQRFFRDKKKQKPLRSVAPVVASLKTERNEDIRKELVNALGYSRDSDAVPALIEALTDKVYLVRSNAAEGLGLLKDARATEALGSMLAKDKDTNCRGAAARALSRIGGPQAKAALQRVASDADTPPYVQRAIRTAIRRLDEAAKRAAGR